MAVPEILDMLVGLDTAVELLNNPFDDTGKELKLPEALDITNGEEPVPGRGVVGLEPVVELVNRAADDTGEELILPETLDITDE